MSADRDAGQRAVAEHEGGQRCPCRPLFTQLTAAAGASRWLEGKAMTADRIEINPDVMLGKPVFRDTRFPR